MSTHKTRFAWMLTVFGMMAVAASSSAMASPINDIPEALGDTLGIESQAAGYILSAAILTSAGLALAVAGKRTNMMATVIVLIAIGVALVVIGWLEYWVLFLIAVFVAGMFASQMRDALTGG